MVNQVWRSGARGAIDTMDKLWRVLRRLLKWAGIAAAGLVALALAFLALAFCINARDEELSPQARALLTPPPNPYQAEDNIYVAFAGSDAPPGQPVIATGLRKVVTYGQRANAVWRDPTPAAFAALTHLPEEPQRLAFDGNCEFVQPLGETLFHTIPRHRHELEKLLVNNRERYERYLAVHDLHGYYETAGPGSWLLPTFWWPTCERKIFLGDYVLRMGSGSTTEQRRALADLESDMRLWRSVFSGEGTMVSKTVAAVYLQGDYLLLADSIAEPQIDVPSGAEEADSLVPVFDLKDWSLSGALAAEFRVTSANVKQFSELYAGGWSVDGEPRNTALHWLFRLYTQWCGHFLKLKATENLLASQTTRLIERTRNPQTFFKTRGTQFDPGVYPEGLQVWTRLLKYNSEGKLLAAVAAGGWDEYPPRVWDVAALQRLVRLSYEIRRQRVAPAAIPEFLRLHPEWSTHPADGRPFLWDATKGELCVQTLGKEPPERRFSVRVWQAPG